MYKNHPHWNEDDWEAPDSGLATDDSLLEKRDVELSTVADVQPSGVSQEEIDDFVANHSPAIDASGNTIIGNTSKEVGQISSELEMVDGKSEKLQTVTRTIVEQHDAILDLGAAADKAQADADSAIEAAGAANAQLGDLLDTDSENSLALWRLQESINENQQLAMTAHSAAIDANSQAIQSMRQEVTRQMRIVPGQSNDFVEVGGFEDTPPSYWVRGKGSWTGELVAIGVQDNSPQIFITSFPDVYGNRTIGIDGRKFQYAFFRIDPGVVTQYRVETSSDTVVLDNKTWTTLASFTVPESGRVSGTGGFRFLRRTYLGGYGARITLNGTEVHSSSIIAAAPLFGDGPRWASLVLTNVSAQKGDIVRLEAYADHFSAANRRVNDAGMDLTVITGRDS
jgi:hypothetical protein